MQTPLLEEQFHRIPESWMTTVGTVCNVIGRIETVSCPSRRLMYFYQSLHVPYN